MKVLYFAQAAVLAGCREEVWETGRALTHAEFWAEALRRHPGLSEMADRCRLASGGEYVGAGDLMDPDLEAAVIPPVSGG